MDKATNQVASHRKDRTEVGREVERVKGWILTQGMDRKLIEDNAGKALLDIGVLSKDIADVSTHNAKLIGVRDRIKQRHENIQKTTTEIRNLELQIDAFKLLNTTAEAQNQEAEKHIKDNPEKDGTAAQTALDRAVETNKTIERAKTMKTQIDLLTAQEERYGDLTVMIEQGEKAISDTIKSLEAPIPGLEFTLDGEAITYNGKIVDTDHLSKGEIMLIEAMLRISKHPNVGALFLGEGESLGTPLLKEILNAAHGSGMHVIMEQVDRGREELTLKFMPGEKQEVTNE
jgi:hypothetical protein